MSPTDTAQRVGPVRRRRFTESDPDAAHERLHATYGVTDLRLLEPPTAFSFGLDLVETDEVGVAALRYSGRAVAELPASDRVLVVGTHSSGRSSLEVDGAAIGAGTVLVPEGRHVRATWHDLDAVAVTLDPTAVALVGAELGGVAPERVRFTTSCRVPADRARYWTACTTHVRRDVLDRDDLLVHPLVRDQVVRHLALALLLTFPNTARGLQQAFAQHHETTPLAHLRRVRLERAHRDLQAADPTDGDTVAAIAARWGFAHAGRFSLTYRESYGVSPSHTLRV